MWVMCPLCARRMGGMQLIHLENDTVGNIIAPFYR